MKKRKAKHDFFAFSGEGRKPRKYLDLYVNIIYKEQKIKKVMLNMNFDGGPTEII